MALNLSMDELAPDEAFTSKVCAWPECERFADGRGYCDKHHHRIVRGRTPGCETVWDEMATAALAWAGAETDEESKQAEAWLKRAARLYGQAMNRHMSSPVPPPQRPRPPSPRRSLRGSGRGKRRTQ